METRLEEVSTGRRKKTEDVKYVGNQKEPYGMYWRSEMIRNELEIEKFMGEDGKENVQGREKREGER